jgi:superfamily II DNA or RNA helicase
MYVPPGLKNKNELLFSFNPIQDHLESESMRPFYKKRDARTPVCLDGPQTPANVPPENRFWISPETRANLVSYVGPKGYTILKSGLLGPDLVRLKTALTARPKKGGPVPSYVTYPVYSETADKLFIPYYYAKEVGFDPSPTSYLSSGADIDVTFAGTLRPTQIPILNTFIETVESSPHPIRGGMLHLPCGWGKTAGTMYLISHFKKRAFILINQENLADQWVERAAQFMPGATIGRIQGDLCEVDNDIVLVMINTIISRTYPVGTFSSCGLLAVDEAHFIGSQEFSKALKILNAPITMGLTATMDRSDGLIWMIQQYLGPVVCSVKRDDVHLDVRIKALYYKPLPQDTDDFMEPILSSTGELMMSSMISKICKYAPYQTFVLDQLREFIRVPEWTREKQHAWETTLRQTRTPCQQCGRSDIQLVRTTCCDKVQYCYACMQLFHEPLELDKVLNILSRYSTHPPYAIQMGEWEWTKSTGTKSRGKDKNDWTQFLPKLDVNVSVSWEEKMRTLTRARILLDIIHRIWKACPMFLEKCSPDEVQKYIQTNTLDYVAPDLSESVPLTDVEYPLSYFLKMMKGKQCPCCGAKTRIGFEQYYIENPLVEPYEKRQTILFANCRQILLDLYKTMIDHNYASVGLYIGNTVDPREIKKSKFKEAEKKQVILATYSMAGTGLDIPTLNAAFFITSKSNIEQPAGRPMRKAHAYPTVIYDFVWPHPYFRKQYTSKRRPYYRTHKYSITEIHERPAAANHAEGKYAEEKEDMDMDIDEMECPSAEFLAML